MNETGSGSFYTRFGGYIASSKICGFGNSSGPLLQNQQL